MTANPAPVDPPTSWVPVPSAHLVVLEAVYAAAEAVVYIGGTAQQWALVDAVRAARAVLEREETMSSD